MVWFRSALLSVFVMLLSPLLGFGSAARPVDLDGRAILELPASFHLDDTPEWQLPAAQRLRRCLRTVVILVELVGKNPPM